MGKRANPAKSSPEASPEASPQASVPLVDRGFQKDTRCRPSKAETFKTKVRSATCKCLRDNFKDFSDEEIYRIRTENGKNLFEQIYHDKWLALSKDSGAPKLGSKWILGLRKCYQRSKDGTADALDVAWQMKLSQWLHH